MQTVQLFDTLFLQIISNKFYCTQKLTLFFNKQTFFKVYKQSSLLEFFFSDNINYIVRKSQHISNTNKHFPTIQNNLAYWNFVVSDNIDFGQIIVDQVYHPYVLPDGTTFAGKLYHFVRCLISGVSLYSRRCLIGSLWSMESDFYNRMIQLSELPFPMNESRFWKWDLIKLSKLIPLYD